MSETMTDNSDLLARIGGYLAARPQYARTFYADHPEVMLKEAADEIAKLREGSAIWHERYRNTADELAKLRAENDVLRTIAESIASRGCNHCNEVVSKARIDLGIYPDLTPTSPEVR